jgi:hypothetical protein
MGAARSAGHPGNRKSLHIVSPSKKRRSLHQLLQGIAKLIHYFIIAISDVVYYTAFDMLRQ